MWTRCNNKFGSVVVIYTWGSLIVNAPRREYGFTILAPYQRGDKVQVFSQMTSPMPDCSCICFQTVEAIDVYCFGHILYEMAFGKQLNSATCEYFSSECPAEVSESQAMNTPSVK